MMDDEWGALLPLTHPTNQPTPVIRYFNEFLMAHSRETAEQVRSEYVDTMGKVYYSYFKDYHSKLMKMQVGYILYMCINIVFNFSLSTT